MKAPGVGGLVLALLSHRERNLIGWSLKRTTLMLRLDQGHALNALRASVGDEGGF